MRKKTTKTGWNTFKWHDTSNVSNNDLPYLLSFQCHLKTHCIVNCLTYTLTCTWPQDVFGYRCKMCVDGDSRQSEVLREISLGLGKNLECVGKFCYLGDSIEAGGGAEEDASIAWVRSAWAKFRELAPMLTFTVASLNVKGKVYEARLLRAML